jgi:hypothetical protein
MANVVEVTLGGKPCVVEGPTFFEVEPGVTPSRGAVTMFDTDAAALKRQNTGHDLVLNDGVRSVTAKSLYIARVETLSPIPGSAESKSSAVVVVHLEDPRSLWRDVSVTGQFNVLREDGTTNYLTNTTASGTTPHTWAQLVQKCTDALGLGITPPDVDWTPQNVQWEFAPAATALEALLRPVGYTIAWQPTTNTYELLDLTDTGSSYTPSGNIVSFVTQSRDVPHDRPATAQIAFRVFRSKAFTFEAVMQHDGALVAGVAGSATAEDGEWATLSTVLGDWGSSVARVNSLHQSCFTTQAPKDLVDHFGGGDVGRKRLEAVRQQAYRFFRINATDKATVVPLTPLRPDTGSVSGVETYLAAKLSSLTYFLPSRDVGDYTGIRGNSKNGEAYNTITGVPPFPVRIVNPTEGIIKVHTPWHLPLTSAQVRDNGNGALPQDWVLVPQTVSAEVGYFKKFSDSSDATADYYKVTKDLTTPNNGKTKTFLAPHVFLREVYDTGSASFTQVNKTDIDTVANDFLDRFAKTFDLPDPIEHLLVGIDTQQALTSTVTGIRWDASDGMTTLIRQFSVSGINALALSPAARAKQFALSAESAVLLNPSAMTSGGRGGDLGSLDNHAPMLKDHGTTDRGAGDASYALPNFINEAEVGLLVAADMTIPASKEKQCPEKPQITKTPGGRPDPTNLLGGKPQVSGGPADGGG